MIAIGWVENLVRGFGIYIILESVFAGIVTLGNICADSLMLLCGLRDIA